MIKIGKIIILDIIQNSTADHHTGVEGEATITTAINQTISIDFNQVIIKVTNKVTINQVIPQETKGITHMGTKIVIVKEDKIGTVVKVEKAATIIKEQHQKNVTSVESLTTLPNSALIKIYKRGCQKKDACAS